MNAEIIAVGTELLLGDILNTNAQYLSQKLAELGFTVHFQSVVGDNPQRLEQLATQAKQRSDIVIYSGGLGPTADDLTKETVAKVYGDPLQFDQQQFERIRGFFHACSRNMPENNRKQAMVPAFGETLDNANGTAPGALFRYGEKIAILLPGPPKEMIPMFEQQAMPRLQKLQKAVLVSRVLRVYGVGESALEGMVGHLLEGENPTAALYAKPAEVIIRITAKAATSQQAEEMCGKTAQQFYDILSDSIYAEADQTLEQTVVQVLAEKGLKVSTAESCTGGLLSQRITAIPGSSQVFECGVCSYANTIKEKLLGVPADVLEQYGAVSPQTAIAMAKGSKALSGADIAVGITGIAGPDGGTPEKPVGLVYISVANGETIWVYKLLLAHRNRETVRFAASQKALDMVRRVALGLEMKDCQCFEM